MKLSVEFQLGGEGSWVSKTLVLGSWLEQGTIGAVGFGGLG